MPSSGIATPRRWSDRTAQSIGSAFPRFDSPACFAALLGFPEHGRWKLDAERANHVRTPPLSRYDTLILETEFETAEGTVRLTTSCHCRMSGGMWCASWKA